MDHGIKVKVANSFSAALLGSCSIDDRISVDDFIDRKNHALALDKFEKTGILKRFGETDNDTLVELLRSVNTWLQKGGVSEWNSFRTSMMGILTNNGKYQDIAETRHRLRHDPESLRAYNYVVSELQRSHKGTSSLEVWKKQLVSISLAPYHRRHAWAKKQLVVLPAEENETTVRNKLKTIFAETKKKLADPFDAAAYLHMELVKLHPFEDGNGGTARLFVAGLLAGSGYMPPIMLSNKEYMAVVNKAIEKNDYTLLAHFLKKMSCLLESIVMNKKKKQSFENLIRHIEESNLECIEILLSENDKNCSETVQEECDSYLKLLEIKKEEPFRFLTSHNEL